MKTGFWLSQRQVKWLIVLLALLPLVPSGLLVQMTVQNALRDRETAQVEMEEIYRSRLAQVAERFSREHEATDRRSLADHLERVFGSDVQIGVHGPDVGSAPATPDESDASAIIYEIGEGDYAGWTLSLDRIPRFPDHLEEQRFETGSYVAVILLGVLLMAGGAWFAIHRQLRVDVLRNDLLTTISHEIKTPVAAAKVLIEALEDGGLDDSIQQDYLALISKENDRVSELTDQFLTYSRLERGQIRLEKRACRLSDLLRNQVALVKLRYEAAGGEIDLDCPADLVVETDPHAVQLILNNLFENALKYGGAPPRCRVRVNESNRRIEISVTDDGPGVPRRERHAVFSRFYQGDAELRSGRSGVGLGLAICRRFVRLLHGEIYVTESAAGEGACFVFAFPR